jgi:hypothetical protein
MSAKHTISFTLNSTKGLELNVLSVSSEGQLLVSLWDDRQLHVYSADYSHVTSITIFDSDSVYDAVWTSRGNIVCTARRSNIVVTILRSSDVMRQTNLLQPGYLSISADDVIYLISDHTSVFQSKDDGLTWNHLFNVSDDCKCWQVVKVSTDNNTDILWAVEYPFRDWRLSVYTVDKRRAVGDRVTRRNVTVPSHVTVDFSNSRLAYDDHKSIFVTERGKKAVHVWSVSGQYVYQLVSPQQLILSPWRVAVDTQRHVMYVGHEKGTVSVYNLTYEPL